ncbi:hypothetical protein ACA910_005571 [Epithemia clementina (nom. ined.)]
MYTHSGYSTAHQQQEQQQQQGCCTGFFYADGCDDGMKKRMLAESNMTCGLASGHVTYNWASRTCIDVSLGKYALRNEI